MIKRDEANNDEVMGIQWLQKTSDGVTALVEKQFHVPMETGRFAAAAMMRGLHDHFLTQVPTGDKVAVRARDLLLGEANALIEQFSTLMKNCIGEAAKGKVTDAPTPPNLKVVEPVEENPVIPADSTPVDEIPKDEPNV